MRNKRHLLSYLAGIFDGEGCVWIAKQIPHGTQKPTHNLRMAVCMCDEAVPRLFHNVFGGKWQIRPSREKQPRTQYAWVVNGYNCLPILKELLPYVLTKRPQFEVAIHFLENKERPSPKHPLSEEQMALREADYILAKSLKTEVHH